MNNMQYKEGAELRAKWKEEGDKPCSHPYTEKEYNLGAQTGDRVCTTCGFDASPEYFKELDANK
ncbi:hypothetical protein [Bacillus cereus]|uniref:hypothetical protein n=2 Tax=Bacillaceae TaxID=186817 RepID=UPI003D2F1360